MADESARVLRIIQDGAEELGLAGTPSLPLERLAELASLVAAWGERMNLTGHRDAETVARRLVLDALALSRVLPASETIADLGSGAGFPGLPLAILRPDSRVFLVESRERRHHFQRQAVRALGLENATPRRGRFDEMQPELCGGVLAQAVAPPDRLLGWMLRWAAPGAWIAVPTGERPEPLESPRIATQEALVYRVPLGGSQRGLWLARTALER